jgi:hypothetical protein
MGDTYGYGETGRHVFDSALLDQTAAKLREKSVVELRSELFKALLSKEDFGRVKGGPEARDRLAGVLDGMFAELQKAGVDIADLASRTLAARDLAKKADAGTLAAARHGGHLPN